MELDTQESLQVYREVMETIKLRLNRSRDFLEWCEASNYEIVTGGMGVEFLYLQLRMICESIALACLIAHNDIPETKSNKIFNNWNAAKNIGHMERIHKDF